MNTIQVTIKADTNDADYVEVTHEFDEGSTFEFGTTEIPVIDFFRKIANAIQDFKDKNKWAYHNWYASYNADDNEKPKEVYKEVLTEEEVDCFNEFIPRGENGIHSIESIEVTVVNIISKEGLL